MANTGLKKHNTFLDYQVGGINVKINLSKTNKNLHYITPLTIPVGKMPIDLSLIYTNSESSQTEYFGKGIRSTLYKKVTEVSSNVWTVENSDFTVDTYNWESNNKYINTQSGNVLTKEYINSDYTYKLYDLEKNVITYRTNTDNYYENMKINGKAKYDVSYSYPNSFLYSNYYGDNLTMSLSSGRCMNCYYRDSSSSNVVFETNLSYNSNGALSGIIVKRNNEIIRSETIEYVGSVGFTFTDNITGYKLTAGFLLSYGVITEYYGNNQIGSTTVYYSNNKTKVVNHLGQSHYYFFNDEGLLNGELIDNESIGYIYNNDFLKPTLITNLFRVKSVNSSNELDLSTFSTSVTMSPTTVSDSDLSSVVTNPYQISGSGNTYKYITKEGSSNDCLTFLVWVKELSVSSNSKAYIEIMVNSETERTEISDLNTNNNYRLISVGINPKTSFTSVRVLIYISNCTLVVGGAQFIEKGFGKQIEYTPIGTIASIKDKYGITTYTYNSNNRVKCVDEYVGNIRNIEYNSNDQIVENRSRYGVIIKDEYDSSNLYNLVKRTYGNIIESFDQRNVYTNKRITKTIDEFSNETFYDYDAFENVSRVMRLNIDVIEYNYNNKGLLSSIIRNPDNYYEAASFTNDTKYRLSTLETASNSIYSFEYDSYNNITSIKLNNVVLMSFTYNSVQLLETVTYGTGDVYTISYSNNYKTIGSININNSITYTYSYDYDLKIIGISSSDINKNFTYDSDDKLITQVINSQTINYKYHLDELKMRIDNINNQRFVQSFNSVNFELGLNPQTLEKYVCKNSNMFIATYSNPIKINNQENSVYAIKNNQIVIPTYEAGLNTNSVIENVGGINAYLPGKNGCYLSYSTQVSSSWDNSIAIGMWIKETNSNGGYIFNIRRYTTGEPAIYARVYNGTIKIYYEDTSSNRTNIINSDNLIELNKWTYVSFKYYIDYVEDDDYSFEIYCFELYVGKKKYTYYSQYSAYKISNLTGLKYHIGYQMINGNINDKFYGYITGLVLNDGGYASSEFLKNYYIESFETLIKNKTNSQAVDYSSSSYYLESNDYQNYDRIPLRGSFDSFNGLKPKIYDKGLLDDVCLESSFSYNLLKGSYAYTPKSHLAYSYNLGNQGTIILNFIVYDTFERNTIFEINNQQGTICVYINDSGYLCTDLFGTTYNFFVTVTKDVWHKIGLSYSYDSTNIRFNMFYDDFSADRSRYLSTFNGSLDIYIGTSSSNNLKYLLFGQIVDVYIKSGYILRQEFDNVNNSLLTISKNESYDSLGRKINDSIIYNNLNALSIEHNYNKTRISSDVIQNNTRSYSYNGRNYISSITDSVYGSHNYTYDERGYLSADNNTTYTYDGNGNIISVGSLSFTYDNTYKDRLISVGGTPITYYSNNMYYPYTFNNKTFYYEGKRLKKVSLSSNREIEFFYDDEGIRYKKIEKNNNVITKTVLFYYDNKQLIGEVINGVKRSYLYDSYGNIYGYIIGNDSYYYIKDSLGIIHSVMNSSGTIIETYTYDAYGNIISTSGSSTNNIKYKGYYYDEEIEMYYLLSRYYYPYWRRFLTPDNYTYLDLENINDLNLFAYCNNNPVMYSDGDGTFAITATALLIGGLIAGGIGAGIGLGTAIYKDYKEDRIFFNGDWTDYLGRTLGGFVTGFGIGVATVLGAGVGAAALGGTTATLFSSTGLSLSMGSAIGIGSGFGLATGMAGYTTRALISRSESYSVGNMLLEGGMNAVSGALSVLGGALGGYAGVHNTVFTRLLSQKGDLLYRILIENMFTVGFKISLAVLKALIEG